MEWRETVTIGFFLRTSAGLRPDQQAFAPQQDNSTGQARFQPQRS
jgi:hypothetical protein